MVVAALSSVKEDPSERHVDQFESTTGMGSETRIFQRSHCMPEWNLSCNSTLILGRPLIIFCNTLLYFLGKSGYTCRPYPDLIISRYTSPLTRSASFHTLLHHRRISLSLSCLVHPPPPAPLMPCTSRFSFQENDISRSMRSPCQDLEARSPLMCEWWLLLNKPHGLGGV